MRRAIILWLIPLTLSAQETRCVVEGMVANGSTGEPLRRATVTLRRTDAARNTTAPTTYTASSDSTGKYSFTEVDPGTYLLLSERNGFASARYNTSVKLDRGQKANGLLLLMTPHSVITGRVLDDEGEPVVGADVQVSTLGYSQGTKVLSRTGGATTNDLGEYRVFGLPAGKYYVSAAFRSNLAAAGSEDFATTYYPRTTDPSAAVPLQVPAGAQMRGIDMALARVRTVAVRGKVACDIEGQKRTYFLTLMPRMVMGIASMSLISRGATVRADGTFEVARVAPGSYMLMASATIDDKRYAARAPVQVGGTNVEGVQIAIRAGGTVTGKLRVEGRPEEHLAGLSVGLRTWESGGVLFGPAPATRTQADGSFQLEDVNTDRYSFYVTGLPEGYYVKSVRSGGADVMASGLEVGGGSAALDVLISPSAGAVEGAVTDPRNQKLSAGATVVLVPDVKERSELYNKVTTDQEGHFRMRNLVPGEYRLFAWEDVQPYAWMDPDFLRAVESKGERITVAEGSPQTVQLKLIGALQ
jgi:protocatechuate 3,4-dioxygenase beta subunit